MVPARHDEPAATPLNRRLATLRIPYAPVLALAGGLAAAAAVLRLTRSYIFYYDEWEFVQGAARWTPGDFFLAHNEHWSTVPRVVYWVMLRIFGASHYLPYMGVLMALHVASSFLLFTLVRRRAGDLAGLVGAAILLLLGRGWEDLIWAFQIGFYSSIFFGLLALVWLDGRGAGRRTAASAALVVSLASSGVGLFFLAAVAAELAADRGRRRALAALVPPVVAYAAWYLVVGRHAASVERNPFTLTALASLRDYAPHGLGAAVASLVSLDGSWAELGLVALVAAIAWAASDHGFSPRLLGALAGLVVMFFLLSLVRGQYGAGQAESSRYAHIAAVFLLLIAGEAMARLPATRPWPALVAVATALVLLGNSQQLVQAAHERRDLLLLTENEIATVNAVRDRPGLERQVYFDPRWLPQTTVGDLLRMEARFGDVVPPTTNLSPAVLQRVFVRGR